MFHLLKACRHLRFRPSVDQSDVSTESFCRTTRVHCSVTTTNDEHLLTYYNRCIRIRIGCIHEVNTCKILVTWQDIDGVFARNTHEIRQSCTRTNEDSFESLCLQLVDRDGFTNDGIGLEVYTKPTKVIYFNINNLVREAEFRDTILQNATYLMQCFEDIHLISTLHHVSCEAQTRWSWTHNSHLDAVGWCYFRQCNLPTLALIVGCEAFQIADSDSWRLHFKMYTTALTLFLLWTNASANGW